MKQRAFDVAHANRNFEIEHFWKRSLFFWGFITTAFAGYFVLRTSHSAMSILISGFGLVCSISWTLANRGSKYWQEYWERKVESLEKDVVGELFLDVEPQIGGWGLWDGRKFSVSKLTIAISDYLVLLWASMFVHEAMSRFGCARLDMNVQILAFSGLTVLYIFLMFFGARSGPERSGAVKRED